jgi:hypothetical protein
MKITARLLLFLTLASCDNESKEGKILISNNFAASHPEWVVGKDTIIKNVNIKFHDFAVPAHIKWVVAKDTSGCLRISYYQIVQKESIAKVQISDVTSWFVPCAIKFESTDERRFETMIINARMSTNKGLKEYKSEGSIAEINGIGEYQQ